MRTPGSMQGIPQRQNPYDRQDPYDTWEDRRGYMDDTELAARRTATRERDRREGPSLSRRARSSGLGSRGEPLSNAELREYSRRHGYDGEVLGLPTLRRRGSVDESTRFGGYTGLTGPTGFTGSGGYGGRDERSAFGEDNERSVFSEGARAGDRSNIGGSGAYHWRDDDDDGLGDVAQSIEREDFDDGHSHEEPRNYGGTW